MRVVLVVVLALGMVASERPLECRQERHRPQIHFSVPSNWLNDPNGMVYYDGEYHLHYQYHPYSTQWGPMHWGHAVSTDLVTWTDLPISLYPDELGMIFSGSAVVDLDNSTGLQKDSVQPIVAIFTHANAGPQQQSIAYSLNKARDFVKYENNPVVPNPGVGDFRDPKVIRYNDKWVMVLAVGNKVDFFGSSDLKTWEFLSDFGIDPSQGSHAGVWECPDLVRIQHNGFYHWVLLVSINPGGPNGGSVTQYFIGSFDGKEFHSNQMDALWMDWGEDNYAAVSFSNEPKGRTLVMGWMNNWAYANELPTRSEGFNGQMTLPRELNLATVDGALRLISSLPEEFGKLRDPSQVFQLPLLKEIPPNGFYNVSEEIGFKSGLVEVDLAFNMVGIEGTSSIAICFVNRQRQEVCTGYDHERPVDKELFMNRELSGDLRAIGGLRRATAGRVKKDNIITFKIVMDLSAAEVFIDNGLTVFTALFFPDEPLDTLEIRHHAGSAESRVTLINGSVQGLRSMYNC
ncbi:unnamed protein product [Allacma fusca]|uniref:Uncharacterized protein n=1 Tax=Allacma fusca TaxID=39272 RepID=A0A8J2PUN3_9HEXA|nr:putative GH32 family protein [Allacma fusca]CAG7822840.1 unnamed protein product [Allacma fusca]